MVSIPQLTIHFHEPNSDEKIILTLISSDGTVVSGTLRLPFALNSIHFILRALNARQYPDYPMRDYLKTSGEDGASLIACLKELGLWYGNDKSGAVIENVHAHFGQMLGNALFNDRNVRNRFDALYNAAIHSGGGELTLSFEPTAPALAAIPWEIAHSGIQPLLLCKGIIINCTRIITFSHAIPPLRLGGERLRILTLAPHAGFDEVGREFEVRARNYLRSSLSSIVDIEHMSPVTVHRLQQRLQKDPRVDILDYYGHGRFRNDIGELLLDTEDSGKEWLPSNRLATIPNLPKLIVLHACQSAQGDIVDPIAGVATALSAAGVHSVVAMQLTTKMEAATEGVTPTLYQKFADGCSIQQAVGAVRQALYVAEKDSSSWYLPVVYLRERALLPPNPFAGSGATGDASRFIGRESLIQKVWGRLKADSNLSIVGTSGSGKTALLSLIATQVHEQIPQAEILRLPIERTMKLLDAKIEMAHRLNGKKATDISKLLKNRHILLLIDELNRLDPGSQGLDIRLWLRDLSQDRSLWRLQLVVTSLRPLEEVFKGDNSPDYSPLHNVLTDAVNLGAFTESEARAYIKSELERAGDYFNLEAFADLARIPMLPRTLQEACRKRYDELGGL